ncbi:hypothetical protein [Arthrobacter sp. UYEF3]|uniref:hypothetical protein n=1 Tax=Arthrobacter sp. UYEF3 TaxID=1756365 RepID=UPI003397D754
MTPATNSPHPTVRTGRPAAAGRPLSTTANPDGGPHTGLGRRHPHVHATRSDDHIGIPYCERCGSDEFVYLETFVPAKHHRDGRVNKLGEVTYFCSGCEDYSAHAVPASWVPPGWYLG